VLPRPRVLLVDDAPELRALLTLQLAGLGCDTEIAATENEAVARIGACPPFDLVLADVHLSPLKRGGRLAAGLPTSTPPPSSRGLGATRLPGRLRAAGHQGRLVTMSAGPAPVGLAAHRVEGHLTKPISREQLAACVRAGLPAEAWSVPPPVSRLSEELAMRPLLQSYVDILDTRATEIEQLTRRGDVRALDKMLHALEGSAGSYGFDEITELARSTGDPLRAGASLTDVLPGLSRLQKLCARARSA
jgi:CheY-like chemotaxis protein